MEFHVFIVYRYCNLPGIGWCNLLVHTLSSFINETIIDEITVTSVVFYKVIYDKNTLRGLLLGQGHIDDETRVVKPEKHTIHKMDYC